MASYKSHTNLPRRTDDHTQHSRLPSTRLPQRSVTPISAAASQLPTYSHSKLQKKRSARDDQAQPGRVATSPHVPVLKSSVAFKGRQESASSVPTPRLNQAITTSKTFPQVSRLPKPEVAGTIRTHSLVSGSSTSTIDSPRSNVLRRKPSSIGITTGRQVIRPRAGSMSSQEETHPAKALPGGFKDPFSETVLGISLPPSSSILARAEVRIEPSGNCDHDCEVGPTEILPLPAPHYALSTTPSTRYSESPGPFSVSSTPTSMSSYSPGVALSTKGVNRTRQASPLQSRPPVMRHKTPDDSDFRQRHALSSVQESSTSSSSTSTVLADGKKQKEKQSARRLPPPPPSPSTKSQPPIQAPPELAHLADGPTSLSQDLRKPVRPSRNGTADITGLREPSPIIQSNMATFPSHRRTSSTESRMAARTRFGLPSKTSSRNPSPSLSATSPSPAPSRLPTREPTPDTYKGIDGHQPQIPSATSTGSVAPSGKPSRFGFFRRTKTEPASVPKAEKKLHRRGPAAGTGHEGYGRYAARGRSASSISGSSIGKSASAGTTAESLARTPSTRKGSITSTTSTEVDDFFLERLAPVTIRGTGSSTELSRNADAMRSGGSLEDGHQPRPELKTSSSEARKAPNKNTPTLLPSAMSDPVRSLSPTKRIPIGPRRPSGSDEDGKRSFLPYLTTRRGSRSSKAIDGALLAKVASSESGTNHSINEKALFEKTAKPTAKASRRWNFFQRVHAAPRVDAPVVVKPVDPDKTVPSRSVAHYALIDAKSGIDLGDIEQILQDDDSATEDASLPEGQAVGSQPDSDIEKGERLQSMLLPPKPDFASHLAPQGRPVSPKVYLRPEEQQEASHSQLRLDTNRHDYSVPPIPSSQTAVTPVTDLSPSCSPCRPLSPVEPTVSVGPCPSNAALLLPDTLPPPGPPPTSPPPRPSRLAQVGRIPQVVLRRNQERPPPSRSFSRPFAESQPRPVVPSGTSLGSPPSIPVTAGATEPYPVLQGLDVLSHGLAIATMSPSAEDTNRQSEFFKFPPRKDSEVSYSSSSGVWSFPPTSGTAIVPVAGAPQSDDEVWKEYDDLIDEVLSPLSDREVEKPSSRPKKKPSTEQVLFTTAAKETRVSGLSGISSGELSNASVHLRRSRLLAVLHSAQSPTSPRSLSDYLQDHGDRSLSVVDPVTGRLSFPDGARMSAGSGAARNRPSSTRSSLPTSLSRSARQSRATNASTSDKDRGSTGTNRYRDTRLMELAETQSDGLVSMANLRFGALMTSKWLSFGRVLFSPAHFELKNPSEDRVLVLDGLGKDWSYYCALTYPEATIYSLGPGAASSPTESAEPWSTLTNYHHISHEGLAAPFPFSQGYFACVVLRFPPALPSSVHRSVISECKRVLRPGGHLEISVLDLDLVNMGNRARRAIRGLKVRIQVADEHVSLRNVSDEIMASLGRKGFTECNRCFVGVPVAGCLPSPENAELSDGKPRKGSNASSVNHHRPASDNRSTKGSKPEVPYSDLLSKHTSSDSVDNGIADMVSRVGRWWYSRCYESLVLPEAGEPGAPPPANLLENSIWKDEALIKECEKRGTSFRLLIGYAQKPEMGMRRTVSV